MKRLLIFLSLLLPMLVMGASTPVPANYIRETGRLVTPTNPSMGSLSVTGQSQSSLIVATNKLSVGSFLTTTNNRLYLGDWLAENGIIGAGAFQIRKQDDHNQLRLVHQGTLAQNWLAFDHARGSFASPTPSLDGDIFGSIVMVGNATNGGGHGGEIKMLANGNWTPSNAGSSMLFYAVPNGSISQVNSFQLIDSYARVLSGRLAVGDVIPTNTLITVKADFVNTGSTNFLALHGQWADQAYKGFAFHDQNGGQVARQDLFYNAATSSMDWVFGHQYSTGYGANDLFYLTGKGFLGIGVYPTLPLHIVGDDSTHTAQLKLGASAGPKVYLGEFGNNMYLTFGGTYSSGWTSDGTYPIPGIIFNTAAGDAAINFCTGTGNGVMSPTKVLIDKSGNLQVVAGFALVGDPTVGVNKGNTLLSLDDTYPAISFRNASNVMGQILCDVSTGTFYIDKGAGPIIFRNANSTEWMRVHGDGNVGIHTNNPQAALHVHGDSFFSGDVSALTFTDRSKSPDTLTNAYAIVSSIRTTNGHVDHSKLSALAWGTKELKTPTGKNLTNVVTTSTGKSTNIVAEILTTIVPDNTKRDLGMVISAQGLVINDLVKRLEALEKK